jgi:hypothetical protein
MAWWYVGISAGSLVAGFSLSWVWRRQFLRRIVVREAEKILEDN